jgi:pimeloyl-ACP methyl ester carboxylesterase
MLILLHWKTCEKFRPVTLVGFSLGARVVFKCLQTLAETEKNAEIVERVVLLGAPISIKNENWRDVRKMVAGRFINVYATNDWTLGVAFRARYVELCSSIPPFTCKSKLFFPY